MPAGVLVLVEHRDGRIKQAALEALGEGRRQKAAGAGPLTALVLGSDLAQVAAEAAKQGCDKVVSVDQGHLAKYDCAAYGKALAEVAAQLNPALVLLAATTMGRDLGPYAAARLECGYAADCVTLGREGSRVLARRPVYAGKAIATVKSDHEPFICSLRPKAFEAGAAGDAAAPAAIETFTPRAEPDLVKAIARSIVRNDTGKLDVGEADIVVSGGRGLGSPEGFKPIEELAKVLGAAVGASRAVVDLGWREHAAQVGQTGKTVSPTLYIACGISGAIQHLAGMRTSKVIVAINRDPEAPIFKVATYGIVGDVFEVVPVLTEAFRQALAARH
jgi:electron transfer flavoprotein alpha subunit